MFDRLFGRKPAPAKAQEMIIAELNARLQPMHRGEHFEDPLAAKLERASLGAVTGGGTLQSQSGEIKRADIEILVPQATDAIIEQLAAMLEELGAPKGSKLRIAGSGMERAFGKTEGLALYLNGTDLPQETYQSCDSNFVLSECNRLLQGHGKVLSYWQGPTETALYMYGDSYDDMRIHLAELINGYPLCHKCRVVQVA